MKPHGEISYDILKAKEVQAALSRLCVNGAREIEDVISNLNGCLDLLARVHGGYSLSAREVTWLDDLAARASADRNDKEGG